MSKSMVGNKKYRPECWKPSECYSSVKQVPVFYIPHSADDFGLTVFGLVPTYLADKQRVPT